MSRKTRARLSAAWLGAWSWPALAQSAPMGAPSDMAPPAPLQSTAISDARPAKDASGAKFIKIRHTSPGKSATHKPSLDAVVSASGQEKS